MTRWEILRGERSVLEGAVRGRSAATDLALSRINGWIEEARALLEDVNHQLRTDSDLESVTATQKYTRLANQAAELCAVTVAGGTIPVLEVPA